MGCESGCKLRVLDGLWSLQACPGPNCRPNLLKSDRSAEWSAVLAMAGVSHCAPPPRPHGRCDSTSSIARVGVMSESSMPREDAWAQRNPSPTGLGVRRGCIREYAARHGGTRDESEDAVRSGVVRKTPSRTLVRRNSILPELAPRLEDARWDSPQSWAWQLASRDLKRARNSLKRSTRT